MSKLLLCEATEIAPGTPTKIEVEDLVLAVFKVEDTIYAIDDQCTHGPGSLSEGELDGHYIECDFHQGGFDVRTGEPVVPPCMIPVRTYEVTVENGHVFIDRTRPAIACANKLGVEAHA